MFFRPIGAFSKSRPTLPCMVSGCADDDDGRSLGCLESSMADCATRNGSGIERVLAEGIEVLISAEKLRGTDLDLGEIGATARVRKRL